MEGLSDPLFKLREASPENFHGFGIETEIPVPLDVQEDENGEILVKRGKRKGRPRGSISRDVTSQLIDDKKRKHELQDNSSSSPVRRCSVRLKSPSPQTPPKRGRGRPRKGEKLSLKTPPSLICSKEPAAYPPSSSGTSSRPLLYLLESSTLSHLSYKNFPKSSRFSGELKGCYWNRIFHRRAIR